MSETLYQFYEDEVCFFDKVCFVSNFWSRNSLDPSAVVKYGGFLSQHITPIISRFGDWIEYPSGDSTLRNDHAHSVYAAAVSSCGRFLFTGSSDRNIIQWDLQRGIQVSNWNAHQNYVFCLDCSMGMSPELLAAGSSDRSISIWSMLSNRKQELKHRIQIATRSPVFSVKFHISGDILVSSSEDGIIRMFSVISGELLRAFIGHIRAVSAVCFASDWIISGSSDTTVKVKDMHSGECLISRVTQKSDEVWSLSLSCDLCLMSVCTRTSVELFEWPRLEPLRMLDSVRGRYVLFHPSRARWLAMATTDTLEIWDVSNVDEWKNVRTMTHTGNHFNTLCFTPDGRRLISVSNCNSVDVWDLDDLF